jgi:hypothetical protein
VGAAGSVFASAQVQDLESPRKVAPLPALSLPSGGGHILANEISLAIAEAIGSSSMKAAGGSSGAAAAAVDSAGNIARTTSTVKTGTLPVVEQTQKPLPQHGPGPGGVLGRAGVVVPLPKIKYKAVLPVPELPPPGTRQQRYPIRKSERAGTLHYNRQYSALVQAVQFSATGSTCIHSSVPFNLVSVCVTQSPCSVHS